MPPASGSRRVSAWRPSSRITSGWSSVDLLIEEVTAGVDLDGLWVAVARRAALDDVRDVDVASVEPGGLEQRREQASGGADERLAFAILVLARSLAHRHHARGHRAVPGHGLNAREVQRACGARAHPPVELEDLFGRRHHCADSSAPTRAA